ncbi:MAG: pseudouridine synthase [Pirellulaceae bacterium]|nr:pseudouridine synthase [Pirellulaceae bacterium]
MSRHKRRSKTARPTKSPGSAPRAGHRESLPEGDGPGERLQKVLAAAGHGSRRDCEELITAGRVEIDRQVVTELGTRVDPVRQEIRVDGEALRRPKKLYFAVNKPVGVVTTNDDPSGRPRVIDLVPTEERVFAVGRIDLSSEGLILVTNDGEFANRITHPRYGVEKTYLVRVAGSPAESDLAKLRKGVYLSDGFCRVQSIVVKGKHKQSTDLLIVLNEGRNRELRRILARVGHKVVRLRRIAVGSIKLADLPVGAWRRLLPAEIESLLQLAREKRRGGKAKKKGPRIPQPAGGELATGPSPQQQALLAEPLSLDDLLRDDEPAAIQAATPRGGGPRPGALAVELEDDDLELGAEDREATSDFESDDSDAEDFDSPDYDAAQFADDDAVVAGPGAGRAAGVIEYEDEEAPAATTPVQPSQPRRFQSGGNKLKAAGGKKFATTGGKRFAKPGGKKFGKPGGKRFAKPDGERRGDSGAKKPFGKSGAKKPFGKPGNKKSYGKSAGQSGGATGGKRFEKSDRSKFKKKFGKPGGRGKNRP